ncbi:hypothetical protein CNEO4_90024 [Clostridium neonatale]|nr:hypothetical protein CNEO_540005 [Clostridium neonatale]CAI3546434.1 hypothetical protein CNEO3_290023 [Clostridium neonatale]CAI3718860.1 hypothetical protein CNEO4_90024 [Clostridium neonatale]
MTFWYYLCSYLIISTALQEHSNCNNRYDKRKFLFARDCLCL